MSEESIIEILNDGLELNFRPSNVEELLVKGLSSSELGIESQLASHMFPLASVS
jgi:hypothetical protein